MSEGVLVVFTAKTVESILAAGGTGDWVVKPESMGHVRYVICTRNADRKHDRECGPRPEPHRAAFLVGKVSGLKKLYRAQDRDRYLIQFSEYALVMEREFRGHDRNPVTYMDVDSVRLKGIDINALTFLPMPPAVVAAPALKPERNGLSMADARAAVALYYDVPPESISITISG